MIYILENTWEVGVEVLALLHVDSGGSVAVAVQQVVDVVLATMSGEHHFEKRERKKIYHDNCKHHQGERKKSSLTCLFESRILRQYDSCKHNQNRKETYLTNGHLLFKVLEAKN